MKKGLVTLGFLGIILFSSSAYADQYGCNGQYGQYGSNCSPSTSILIDKTVGKPLSNNQVQYVDNLSSSDYQFKPGQTVNFQLKVKNTSSAVLNNVKVTDVLPAYLNASAGPGNYDANTKTITVNVGDLQPNQEQVYTLQTVVVSQSALPADQSIICMVNKAKVTSNQASDDDTAQLCVGKQVLSVTSVPSTGPEMGVALMAGEAALLTLGVYLKKRLS